VELICIAFLDITACAGFNRHDICFALFILFLKFCRIEHWWDFYVWYL